MWACPVLHWRRQSSVQNLSVILSVGGILFARENLNWGGLGVFVHWCLHSSHISLFLRPAMYACVLCSGFDGVRCAPVLASASVALLLLMPECPGHQLIAILIPSCSFRIFLIVLLKALKWACTLPGAPLKILVIDPALSA